MYPVQASWKRLRLRELESDDAAAVHVIYGDALVTRHLSFEPRSRDQANAIVARFIAAARGAERSEYALAVTPADRSRLIGLGRLALDPHQQRAATLGFALHPEVWGQGLGRETVESFLSVAFDQLDLHRVWAARAPLNTVSEKTLLGAGMTEEGRIREHVFVRGAWRDSVVYAILDHEWRRR